VRDSVVDVEEVELVCFGHFGHAGCQGETVGLVLKEGIVADLDLVVVNSWRFAAKANRIGIGDEVNLVPARGQLDAKLGGDDAAAAVSGIASDADSHRDP
jgi:hypothetical protein